MEPLHQQPPHHRFHLIGARSLLRLRIRNDVEPLRPQPARPTHHLIRMHIERVLEHIHERRSLRRKAVPTNLRHRRSIRLARLDRRHGKRLRHGGYLLRRHPHRRQQHPRQKNEPTSHHHPPLTHPPVFQPPPPCDTPAQTPIPSPHPESARTPDRSSPPPSASPHPQSADRNHRPHTTTPPAPAHSASARSSGSAARYPGRSCSAPGAADIPP